MVMTEADSWSLDFQAACGLARVAVEHSSAWDVPRHEGGERERPSTELLGGESSCAEIAILGEEGLRLSWGAADLPGL